MDFIISNEFLSCPYLVTTYFAYSTTEQKMMKHWMIIDTKLKICYSIKKNLKEHVILML